MAEEQIDVENPVLGKLKISGQNICVILGVAALMIAALTFQKLYAHDDAAAKADYAFRELAKATRELGCMVAHRNTGSTMSPTELIDFCKRFSG